MFTNEMRDLVKSDEGASVLRSMLAVKSKGLPERLEAVKEKKASIRKMQDEINKENRFITRDRGAVIRMESVLVEAGVMAEADCQFFGKEEPSAEDEAEDEAEAEA